jgi:bifunctional non-homologous end joining protein LigD
LGGEQENGESVDPKIASKAKRTDPNPQPLTPDPLPQVRFTNLDKVFWPEDGFTKGDLLRYYESVWPWLEPYLRNRPVVLTRYPDGIHGKSFFQKNAPEFVPDWVPTCRVDDTEYFVCDDLQALLYVINLGCIPLHAWSARRNSIEHPDWTILDLDPKGAPFSDVLRVAKHVHGLLAPLDAPHFVKTSGQDGLHILIPLNASLTHEEAKTFAEVLARVVAGDLPDIATVARPLGDRGGKVYVDFLQNGFGKTIAAPFSARPKLGAPVSMPLDWKEVNARLDPRRFTIRSAPARLAKRGDPMRDVLGPSIDVPSVLAALTERMKASS